MRIEEMRSGLSHLRKKDDEAVSNNVFEMRSLIDPDLLPALTDAALAAEARERAAGGTTTSSPETAATPPKQGGELGATTPEQGTEPVAEAAAASELDERCWSVVSFERVEAASLIYAQATAWMDELQLQGVTGLCIVTDAVAKRLETKTQAQPFQSSR
jgi:hypothetical protein